MADNTILPGTGESIASDDIGGVKHQRIKLIHGADGVNAGDVAAGNPLPTSISQNTPGDTNGVQITALTYPSSTANNSTAQLTAGASFTGGIETVLSLQAAQIMVTCDQPYSVFIDQYIDLAGTARVATYTFTRLAGVPLNENVTLPGNYMRVRVQNTGAVTTTTFRVDTTFGIMNTQPNTLSDAGNLRVVNQENGTASVVNSTAVNLGAAATFTGTGEDVSEYSAVMVSVFASHASTTDGLSIQFSSNGTNWDLLDVFTVPAATGKTYSFGVLAKFYRLVYTNGGTLTTSLRIQTLFSRTTKKASSQRPSDGRSNDNDFEEGLSYQMGFNGTSWDRLRSTTANGLSVDVTRGPVDVTASGSLAGAAQVVTLALAGQSAAAAQITGTWVGTITFEASLDGTTWTAINAVSASTSSPQTTTTVNGLYRITPGGLQQFRANMSAFTSGSATVLLRAGAGTGGVFVNQVLPVRGMNDTSRNHRAFMLDIHTAAPLVEALQSVVQWYGNAAVAGTTTPAIVPIGKTLRLTNWSLSTKSLSTVGSAVLRIRANTGGTVLLVSPLVWSAEVGSIAGATTVAMTGALDNQTGSFPEGFEFPAGTGLGFTLAGYGPTGVLALQGVTRFQVFGYEF